MPPLQAPTPVERGTPPRHAPPLGAYGASILKAFGARPPLLFLTNRTLHTVISLVWRRNLLADLLHACTFVANSMHLR